MPLPLSDTRMTMPPGSRRADTLIVPIGSVYLAALLRRLAKTCDRRAGSPSISNPVAISTCSVCCRSSIAGLAISIALATTSAS